MMMVAALTYIYKFNVTVINGNGPIVYGTSVDERVITKYQSISFVIRPPIFGSCVLL